MRVMCLSGWGQPHDALAAVAPEATHVDYARHADMAAALAEIAQAGQGHDMVIGWSLGGQMALRAVAAGMMRPKRLVLIAASFRFVAAPDAALGMKRGLYEKFRENYARNPLRTLSKGWELISKDDAHADRVRTYLAAQDKTVIMDKDWLRWLDMLDGFSFEDVAMDKVPPTLLIHGGRDVVVAPEQSARLAEVLPQARLAMLEEAGHAPHWHDAAAVRRLIAEHAHV